MNKQKSKIINEDEAGEVRVRGPYFMSQNELFSKLGVGRSTYEKLTNPSSEHYDPDFPKPVSVFTGKKYRYSSIDVDHYIRMKSHFSDAA